MKKSLIALAVLAASGAAMAQSSVTLFGIVDVGVTSISNKDNGRNTGMSNGGASTNRLGFRGTETLDNGLKAGFWLEGELSPDTGDRALNFQRRSTLSLSGDFGEVRLGRDQTPTYQNNSAFDPFGNNGVGQARSYGNIRGVNNSVDQVRNSNSVGYFLPEMGGIYGQAQYAFSEKPTKVGGNTNDLKNQGQYFGGRVGYNASGLNAAVSYGQWTDVGTVNPKDDLKVFNIGASYDLGMVKPSVFFGNEKLKDSEMRSFFVAATAPMGEQGELRASIGRYDLKKSDNDFTTFAIGYGYNLSKRTQVYTTLAALRNKSESTSFSSLKVKGLEAPGAGKNSTGFDVGIRHSF